MEPANRLARRRFTRRTRRESFIQRALNANVRARFELQVAPFVVGIEVIAQRTLDVARPRVVTLDQVASSS